MADNKLFSMESEEAVLSMILKNPELIHHTCGLDSFMFSANPHIALFTEMKQLAEKQQTPDPTLILASLESRNALDSVGGKFYIEKLLKKEYNESTFPEFCKFVVDSYKARSLLSMASGIKASSLNSETIDEVITSMRRGLDGLMEMRQGSATFHVADLVKDTYTEILARRSKPGIRGTTWGVTSLDNATGGKSPGDLIAIGGRPGAGKTALICNSVLADALAGVPSLLITREMRPLELMERLISIETGLPNTNIRLGVLKDSQVKQIYDSLDRIRKLPIYLDANFRTSDPYYLESLVNKYHNKYGVQNVYFDYVQIGTERDDNQTQEIGRLTRLFKLMANDLGICSIILSQLNRQVETRDDKRPMMSDFKQSGAIEEDSDFVIGLYRDEHYNKETKHKGIMEYLILKHRNGPVGTVTLRYEGNTYKISEA